MAIDRGGVISVLGVVAVLGVLGAFAYQAQSNKSPRRGHGHPHAASDRGPGAHAHVVTLGNDEYHAELVLTADGRLHVFTLGADETRVETVPSEVLPALLKGPSGAAVEVSLAPAPQTGDAPGTTSRFTLTVPASVTGRPLELTVPNLAIGGTRFRFTATVGGGDHVAEMPAKVTDDEERTLYLTAGGAYTVADIAANGKRTAGEKFKGFRAKHDSHPKPGDAICPVTSTKAHPDCGWVVGGKTYTFCCPPCVDEFVKQSKEKPGTIRPPQDYVQK